MATPDQILFVCLGNIVRSPLAENLFVQLAEQRGLADRFVVDSAGTSSYHVGDPPDQRMRNTAAGKGFTYGGRSRQLSRSDLERFDLIVAMDRQNASDIRALASRPELADKVRLMREFDPEANGELDVPDPYYGGQQGFENTFAIVHRSVETLLDHLEQDQV
jgi:protein-tyrosine phosphatase